MHSLFALRWITHSACPSPSSSFFSFSFFFGFPFGEFLSPEPLQRPHELMDRIQISESTLSPATVFFIMTQRRRR